MEREMEMETETETEMETESQKAVMAYQRTAVDAAFGDLEIASTQSLLLGSARMVPGEPFPLDAARAGRALRLQQLSIMRSELYPLGMMTPSFSHASQPEELGPLSLQSLGSREGEKWWVGSVTQVRPKKLISAVKAEVSTVKAGLSTVKAELSAIKAEIFPKDEWKRPKFKHVKKLARHFLDKSQYLARHFRDKSQNLARHFLDKSLYSHAACFELDLPGSTNLLMGTEALGEREGRRYRAMLFHERPDHDVLMKAAWPELYIDHDGKYWEVPKSTSLDCSSCSESGLHYRFGFQSNSGYPQAINSSQGKVPLALLPGLCAKAAFTFGKSIDLWRQEKEEDFMTTEETDTDKWSGYDVCLTDPHAAVSGIIGGSCAAWVRNGSSAPIEMRGNGDGISLGAKKRSRFSADLFGSVCCTFQLGNFKSPLLDLTRVDARLNICSAAALLNAEDPLSSPRLNLTLQQQVAGPLVFRVDSRFSLGSSYGKQGIHTEDRLYSLSYHLDDLKSGKLVAWYSPKRKEAMVEMRFFDF